MLTQPTCYTEAVIDYLLLELVCVFICYTCDRLPALGTGMYLYVTSVIDYLLLELVCIYMLHL